MLECDRGGRTGLSSPVRLPGRRAKPVGRGGTGNPLEKIANTGPLRYCRNAPDECQFELGDGLILTHRTFRLNVNLAGLRAASGYAGTNKIREERQTPYCLPGLRGGQY